MDEIFGKMWIETLIREIGFKSVVKSAIGNNDTETAKLIYYNYKKRLRKLGKQFYIIQGLAIMNVLTNGEVE